MEVQSIAIHPKWDRTDQLNDIFAGHDIALLKLSREVASYNSRVVPICLPDPVRDRYLLREDTAVEVTGFGLITTSSGLYRKLERNCILSATAISIRINQMHSLIPDTYRIHPP